MSKKKESTTLRPAALAREMWFPKPVFSRKDNTGPRPFRCSTGVTGRDLHKPQPGLLSEGMGLVSAFVFVLAAVASQLLLINDDKKVGPQPLMHALWRYTDLALSPPPLTRRTAHSRAMHSVVHKLLLVPA